jgi:hypothetical protein
MHYPHEYIRNGTAKQLTLLHPASGEVRVKGVRRTSNAVLHPWLQEQLTTILATLPEAAVLPSEENRRRWAGSSSTLLTDMMNTKHHQWNSLE